MLWRTSRSRYFNRSHFPHLPSDRLHEGWGETSLPHYGWADLPTLLSESRRGWTIALLNAQQHVLPSVCGVHPAPAHVLSGNIWPAAAWAAGAGRSERHGGLAIAFAVLNDAGKEKEQKRENDLVLSLSQGRQAGLCCGASSLSLETWARAFLLTKSHQVLRFAFGRTWRVGPSFFSYSW